MKVLTIKQPFASLIAEGYKEYEFRTWKTKYRGPLLIHAGLGVDKEAMKRYEKLNLNYPKGKIIAKVNLTDCIEVDNNLKSKLKEKNYLVYQGAINSNKKEYAFKLENVEKIEEISIKGKLSFWDYDYKK
mgnify:FL=1